MLSIVKTLIILACWHALCLVIDDVNHVGMIVKSFRLSMIEIDFRVQSFLRCVPRNKHRAINFDEFWPE